MIVLKEEFGEKSIYDWLAYRLVQLHKETYGDDNVKIIWKEKEEVQI